MSPIKSTFGRSVGKLLSVFRDRDLTLNSSVKTNRYIKPLLATATGGTQTSGQDESTLHVFTSPGTFTVTSQSPGVTFDYLVIGGGGAGSAWDGSGYRAGGVGSASYISGPDIATITSNGGGGGGEYPGNTGTGGGSGGGGGGPGSAGGSGNSPSPSPNQGYPGGSAGDVYAGGGGGGAGGAGVNGISPSDGGVGGIGKAFSWIPPSYGTEGPTPGRWFAGGGGGYGSPDPSAPGGAGGGGEGGGPTASNAVANTGGGGGGQGNQSPPNGGGCGGGGAGGLRTSMPEGPGGPSPVAESKLSLTTGVAYTVEVGNGHPGNPNPSADRAGGSGIVIIRF